MVKEVLTTISVIELAKLRQDKKELLEALEKMHKFAEEVQSAFRSMGWEVPIVKANPMPS